MPAESILAGAPGLAAQGWYVVPVVQRWIASPAVLPCRRLVERLVLGAWQVHRPAVPRGAVLIADGERAGKPGYPDLVPGRAFDNRYEYQINCFPSTAFLKARGIVRVQWITTDPQRTDGPSAVGATVRTDLLPYLEALLQAEIAVEVQAWPPDA